MKLTFVETPVFTDIAKGLLNESVDDLTAAQRQQLAAIVRKLK